MRFQDAAQDARAVVYAGIQAEPVVARAARLLADASPAQRVLARAVMNGESEDAETWRAMFPTLFRAVAGESADDRASEAVLAVSLEVAARGDRVRDQLRGAIVEALTEHLLRRTSADLVVRRERRILFDGVRAEIHPYDVTVEPPGVVAAYDCKWGARGLKADVLHQLDDARSHALDEDVDLHVGLVVFDALRSCDVRLSRETAPVAPIEVFAIETLDRLGTSGPPPS